MKPLRYTNEEKLAENFIRQIKRKSRVRGRKSIHNI